MSPVRFALIGVGGVGALHLEAIHSLEREGSAKLVAAADPTLSRFPELEHQLQQDGVRLYRDYRDLLEDEHHLDAVTIATPIPFHYDMTRACIARGLFVQLEKPPAPLIQQLTDLLHHDQAGRVSVGFQMIGSRCLQAFKQLIIRGDLGRLQTINGCGCWPRMDRYYQRATWAGRMTLNGQAVFDGPATNALAHLIHNVMFLAGDEPAGFAAPTEVEGELYRARPIESYDFAALRGKFPSGVSFHVAVSHATKKQLPFCLEVHGSKGWGFLSEDGAKLTTSAGVCHQEAESTIQLIDRNYRQFIAAIRDGTHRFASRLQDTLGYVQATNAMLLSSGGIHPFTPDSVSRYTCADDSGYDVTDLHQTIETNFRTGKLPSESGSLWATARPVPISCDTLLDSSLIAYFPGSEQHLPAGGSQVTLTHQAPNPASP